MARRFYEPKAGGTELDLVIDPQTFTQVQDQDDLAIVTEFQTLSDVARAEVAVRSGFPTLEAFDSNLTDRFEELSDRLDYYGYENRQETINVRDGAWFIPDAIAFRCGEEVGNEAGLAIDGVNSTSWRHNTDERHTFIVQLRPYSKRFGKIRIRHGAGGADREKLTNIDVRASRNLNNIGDANNLIATGLNPTWTPGDWTEIDFGTIVNRKIYLSLEFDTADAGNQAAIRELEVRVLTRKP